jgi:hypothetical protein
VAHFEPLSRHMSGGMQEDHEIWIRIVELGPRFQICPPEYEEGLRKLRYSSNITVETAVRGRDEEDIQRISRKT